MNRRNLVLLTLALSFVVTAWAASGTNPTPAPAGEPAATDGPCAVLTDLVSIPRMINYQGRLLDGLGNPVIDTTYTVLFRIYSQPLGGLPLYEERQFVQTTAGLFHVLIGSVVPVESMPSAGTAYLALQVEGDPEMQPRQQLASAPYAYGAARADTAGYALAAQVNRPIYPEISTDEIAPGAVTMNRLNQEGARPNDVVKWDGNAWRPMPDSTGTSDNPWIRSEPPDSILYTVHRLGIARGDAENALLGNNRHTHANLGTACTTGVSGQDRLYATVSGGFGNRASGEASIVAGGVHNTASGLNAAVLGGERNVASGSQASVIGGFTNSARSGFSVAAGQAVTVDEAADGTFAFGRDFATSTPDAVVFNHADGMTRLGIGVTDPAPGHLVDVRGGAYCDGTQWFSAYNRETELGDRTLAPDELDRLRDELARVRLYRYRSPGDGRERLGLDPKQLPALMLAPDGTGVGSLDAVACLLAALKAQQDEIDALRQEVRRLAR